jgi:hypothetical protein
MPLAIWFWVLMFFWVLFGFWRDWVPGQPYPWRNGASNLLLFFLLLLLGWAQFGSPVK